jgi:hypothetical protein
MGAGIGATAATARWTRRAIVVVIVATVGVQLAGLARRSAHVQFHGLGEGVPGLAITLAHALCMAVALVQLALLLGRLERGELFSMGVTHRLRQFALFALLASVLASVVAPLVLFFLPSCAAAAPCPRRVMIDIRGLWTLVISLVFFLVARILDEARRIEEDHRQII